MQYRINDTPPREEMESFSDFTLFQSEAWMNFVADAQRARPVVAEIRDGADRIGWFAGLIVKKLGLRILGSPFPGWTTSYMGFNLPADVSRSDALKSLIEFSKKQLKCTHLELMDRHLTLAEVKSVGCHYRLFTGFEVDLSVDENTIWNNLAPSTRRNIRKGEREGIEVDVAVDDSFAHEYYEQLTEVFARQRLKPTYPSERVRLLLKYLLPTGRLLCLRASKPDGTCIATGIFPADRYRMYFWGGASRSEFRILRPNEAIQWYAMRYWRDRGVNKYDMGGGGQYKRKYGGVRIEVPWVRHSHLPGFETFRNMAQRLVSFRQRL
jgi:CelD/BcsL family acetyltransferase involved in cellulose biosynthesis